MSSTWKKVPAEDKPAPLCGSPLPLNLPGIFIPAPQAGGTRPCTLLTAAPSARPPEKGRFPCPGNRPFYALSCLPMLHLPPDSQPPDGRAAKGGVLLRPALQLSQSVRARLLPQDQLHIQPPSRRLCRPDPNNPAAPQDGPRVGHGASHCPLPGPVLQDEISVPQVQIGVVGPQQEQPVPLLPRLQVLQVGGQQPPPPLLRLH